MDAHLQAQALMLTFGAKIALLSGNYPDTHWRHCVRCNVRDQRYAAEVTRLVDSLELHKVFFANLKSTGGECFAVLQS